MHDTHNVKKMSATGRPLIIGRLLIVTIVILGFAASVAAQRVISVAPFRSIEVRDGAHVTLRYGQIQNVTR